MITNWNGLVAAVCTVGLIGCAINAIWTRKPWKASTDLDSEFTQSPSISPLGKKYWYLQRDLEFVMTKVGPDSKSASAGDAQRAKIVVPAGFVTDLASIPLPASFFFSKAGRYAPAGIVHDYLYWVQPCGEGGRSRRIADQIIKEALKASDHNERRLMKDHGKPLGRVYRVRRWLSRNAIKYGVIWGGWWAWRKNRKARQDGGSRYLEEALRNEVLLGSRWEHLENELGSELPELAPGAQRPGYCSGFFNNIPDDEPATG